MTLFFRQTGGGSSGGVVEKLGDITNVDTSLPHLESGVVLRYEPSDSKWVAENNFLVESDRITLMDGDFYFDGIDQSINGSNAHAPVDDICKTANMVKDTATDLVVGSGTTAEILKVDKTNDKVYVNGVDLDTLSSGGGNTIVTGTAVSDGVNPNRLDFITADGSIIPVVLDDDFFNLGISSDGIFKTNNVAKKVSINKDSAPSDTGACLEVDGGISVQNTSVGSGVQMQISNAIYLTGGQDYVESGAIVSITNKISHNWKQDAGTFEINSLKCQQTPLLVAVSSGALSIDQDSLTYKTFYVNVTEDLTALTLINGVPGCQAVVYLIASETNNVDVTISGKGNLSGIKANFEDIVLGAGDVSILTITKFGAVVFASASKFE